MEVIPARRRYRKHRAGPHPGKGSGLVTSLANLRGRAGRGSGRVRPWVVVSWRRTAPCSSQTIRKLFEQRLCFLHVRTRTTQFIQIRQRGT
jgi:hypothetical protein